MLDVVFVYINEFLCLTKSVLLTGGVIVGRY